MKLVIEYEKTFIITKLFDNSSMVMKSTNSVSEVRAELEEYILDVLGKPKPLYSKKVYTDNVEKEV